MGTVCSSSWLGFKYIHCELTGSPGPLKPHLPQKPAKKEGISSRKDVPQSAAWRSISADRGPKHQVHSIYQVYMKFGRAMVLIVRYSLASKVHLRACH